MSVASVPFWGLKDFPRASNVSKSIYDHIVMFMCYIRCKCPFRVWLIEIKIYNFSVEQRLQLSCCVRGGVGGRGLGTG